MRYFSTLVASFLLYGCAALPELAHTVENIANDDAITVKVDKDAFQKSTDVEVSVKVNPIKP
jgi:hypothetical protein